MSIGLQGDKSYSIYTNECEGIFLQPNESCNVTILLAVPTKGKPKAGTVSATVSASVGSGQSAISTVLDLTGDLSP